MFSVQNNTYNSGETWGSHDDEYEFGPISLIKDGEGLTAQGLACQTPVLLSETVNNEEGIR